MNGRQRLTAIFENREYDRPALKLWGFAPGQALMSNAYEPVYKMAMEKTDWMLTAGSAYNHLGSASQRLTETFRALGPAPDWEDVTTLWHLPGRTLKSINRTSREGKPGYELEHLVKSAEDVEALLSMPFEPDLFDPAPYIDADRAAGDRGIAMYRTSHAMYMLQFLTGPETFAFMSYECRDLMEHAIGEFARRIHNEVERVFDAGLKPVFSWVGPEVCIPPLMSPADFEAFVFRFDKPLCDYIHERGGHVWVHCHNRVGRFISRFIDMGVDVLNPVEPPPMGDITLKDAVSRFGNKIGLEGNIETHDLWSADSSRIRELVIDAVAEGSQSGRFILCPSAGYMEFPNPTQRYIDNLLAYLETGYEQVNLCRKG